MSELPSESLTEDFTKDELWLKMMQLEEAISNTRDLYQYYKHGPNSHVGTVQDIEEAISNATSELNALTDQWMKKP